MKNKGNLFNSILNNKESLLFNSILNNKDSLLYKLKNCKKEQKRTIAISMAVVVMAVLCFCGLGTSIASLSSKIFLDGASKYDRTSDPSTMDSYKDFLLSDENGSRNAGRVWADKTVFSNNSKGNFELNLDTETDGLESKVGINTDFLHVFSALGSSQVIDQYSTQPLDVVLLLDISTSMTSLNNGNMSNSDSLHQVVKEANSLIASLMGEDDNYVVNPDNRVGVIVYGGGAQELLPLAHYESANNNNTYMSIASIAEGTVRKSNNKAYFPLMKTVVKTNDRLKSARTTKAMLADATYLQGALYKGMEMLSTEKVTTYRNKITGKDEARIPVLITLTDGATNIISTTSSSKGGNASYDWFKPYGAASGQDIIPTASAGAQYAAEAANPYYADCNENTGHGTTLTGRNSKENREKEVEAIVPRTVSNLLLAGYYQKKIEAHYATDMKNYTIGFNIGGVGDYATEQLLATLNPQEYFREGRSVTSLAQTQITNTKNVLNQYISGAKPNLRFPQTGNHIFLNGGYANFTWNHPADTEYDITSLDDVNYVDKYYTTSDDPQGNIGAIFGDIFNQIAGSQFNPIAGSNDSGVKDSITYMDPIGQYMELKDKGISVNGEKYDLALSLFGEMHGVVKSAVYNYKFNVEHGPDFKEGWYSAAGEFKGASDDAGSWEAGDTYYLSGATIRNFVPQLDTDNLTEKQMNTIYTIYRFDKNLTTGVKEDSAERAKDKINPCYDNETTKYKLSDFRIWVEDTGDYNDQEGGSIIDTGYDRMLYVNVPSAALPIQVAKIELETNGNLKSYNTNLNDYQQSTPIRVFYGIGVEDDVKTEDKQDIDLTKLSAEYIQEHTEADGSVYFLSNYFSDTRYDGYVTDTVEQRQRGDANFTFSPNSVNRFYSFQSPLLLYEIKEDELSDDHSVEETFKTKTEYDAWVAKHNRISTNSKIDSDKDYWIVLDYYVPGNAEIVHTAVKRRGSEFGSFLGEDKTGEFLTWYNPDTGDQIEYVAGSSQPASGYYLATKPGGLRVGNLAQARRAKSNNKTETSASFYLPTVSNNSTGSDGGLIFNGYLGNNGKLLVSDDYLEITKEVEPAPTVKEDGTGEEKFKYKLSIGGTENPKTGNFRVYKTFKNPYSNKWQLRVSTIDVLTNNKGLLQISADNLATYENGNYIYIGNNTSDTEEYGGTDVFRVYSADDNDINVDLTKSGRTVYVNSLDGLTDSDTVLYRLADEMHPAGSIDIWVRKAYLVPEEQLDSFDGNTAGLQELDYFVISNIDSNRPIKLTTTEAATQKLQVYSEYYTSTKYLTEEINFELDPETSKYVAEFSLGHNEGIIINGLDNGIEYSVEEVLTEEQIEKGYRFDRAYGDKGNILRADNDSNTKFSGNVDSSEEVHYVNRSLNALSITKTLKGLDSRADVNKLWKFNITLRRGTAEKVGGDYYYIVTDKQNGKVINKGTLTFESTDGGETYTASYEIKSGETLTIYGILDGTEYEITEDGANENGYFTTVTKDNAIGTLVRDADVEFVNNNPREYDIVLSKIVEGFAGDKEKEWNFKVTLTPPAGLTIPTTYQCTGIACVDGAINFEHDEATNTYTAIIKLKHNETITIKDILEGTTYNIEELEADTDGYDTSHTGQTSGTFGSGSATRDQEVTFTNTKYSYHELTFGKLVKGEDADPNRVWTFRIILTPASGMTLDTEYEYVGGVIAGYEDTVTAPANGRMTFTRNARGQYVGEISVIHGQKITLKGIPERTTYQVYELNQNKDGYTAVNPDNTMGGFDSKDATAEVIITNVNLSEHDLIIEKQVEGTDGDTTKDWHFTVELTPDTTTGVEFKTNYQTEKNGVASEDIEFTETSEGSGVYTAKVTLKHNEQIKIKGLPEGTKYKVVEDEADLDNYMTKHTDNTTGTLENATDTQHLIFRNIRLAKQTLTLAKVVEGKAGDYTKDFEFDIKLSRDDDIELGNIGSDDNYSVTYEATPESKVEGVEAPSINSVTFTKQTDGSYHAKVTLKHGQSLTINGIPEGTKYEIVETEANQDSYVTYTTEDNTSGEITADDAINVVFHNKKPELLDLTLSKIVGGQKGDKTKEFNFTIKFTPDEHVNFPTQFNYTGTKDGILSVSKTSDSPVTYEGTVTLHHEDTITIYGIPENTKYEIVEKEANKDGYITTVEGEETGTLVEPGTKVTFTNTNLADFNLTIKKNIKGNAVESDRSWDFEIILIRPVLKDLDSTYKYIKNGDESEEFDFNISKNEEGNYVGHIFLKGGESATIKGLPEGTGYIVNEVEADQDGYITTSSDNTEGNIDKDGIVVEYNNWRFTRHMLSIEKQLKGNGVDPNRDWTFEITLTVDEDMPFDVMYPYVKNTNEEGYVTFNRSVDNTYKAIVHLKGGEKITIKDLPNNIKYTVTEEEANTEGYTTTSENETGVLTETEHKVLFVNEKDVTITTNENPSNPLNPNTSDGIMKYIALLLVSMCELVVVGYLTLKNTKKANSK